MRSDYLFMQIDFFALKQGQKKALTDEIQTYDGNCIFRAKKAAVPV